MTIKVSIVISSAHINTARMIIAVAMAAAASTTATDTFPLRISSLGIQMEPNEMFIKNNTINATKSAKNRITCFLELDIIKNEIF